MSLSLSHLRERAIAVVLAFWLCFEIVLRSQRDQGKRDSYIWSKNKTNENNLSRSCISRARSKALTAPKTKAGKNAQK